MPSPGLSAYPVDVSEGGCKKYENILWKVGLSCESPSDASEIRRPGTRSNKIRRVVLYEWTAIEGNSALYLTTNFIVVDNG